MSPEQVAGRTVDHADATSSRSASSSTRWPADGVRSRATRRSSSPPRSCATRRSRSTRSAPSCRPTWRASSGECLEKDPRPRIQTARDVSNELARPGATVIVDAVAHPSPASRRASTDDGSGAARAEEEGFWVAVLPFKYRGANADLTALAEGLSEEIVTGLSRFSYLRVIARSSTAGDTRARRRTCDPPAARLGARYVMEGSLRQAGTTLRLAVQLVDAVSGAHLWAENYERTVQPGRRVRAARRSRFPASSPRSPTCTACCHAA